MNRHKKELGLKIPENYFKESRENILSKNLNSTDKEYSFRFYQLSFAAIFIFTLIYFNYPFLESFKQNDLAKKFMTKGGTIMSFKIKGDKEKTYKFINNLKIFDITNNIGDTKSLVTHPATTTHRVLSEEERANLDITDNLVRISIGLENIEDLKQDLDQSLSKS